MRRLGAMNPNAPAFVPGGQFSSSSSAPPFSASAASASALSAPASDLQARLRETLKADSFGDVVSTKETLQALLKRLSFERLLSIDCEGSDLSKGSWRDGTLIEDTSVPLHGQLTLLQVALQSGEAFAIDLLELGSQAFDLGLRDLLQNPSIIKVVHDFRQDEDALWHQFRVRVQGLFDCQMCDILIRRLQGLRTTYVQGGAKLMATHGIELVSVPGYGPVTQEMKLRIHERFSQDRHLWIRRPLPFEMVQYAKADVLPLSQLYQKQVTDLCQLTGNQDRALRLAMAGSAIYASSFRVLPHCRCRLCCNAVESAKFDGHKVLSQLTSSRMVEPWFMERLWRPEDSQALPTPGPSQFYVDEFDQSVPLFRG